MKKFCQYLREHEWRQLILKRKNEAINKLLTIFIKKKFEDKYVKDKKYRKVRDHCQYTGEYRGAGHGICNLKYSIPKENSIVFHNGSSYDNHVIMKELAAKFEK